MSGKMGRSLWFNRVMCGEEPRERNGIDERTCIVLGKLLKISFRGETTS